MSGAQGSAPPLTADQLGAIAARYADVSHDSRRVAPGSLFACVVGASHDGHRFAAAAISAGATGLLVERPLSAGDLGVDEPRLGEIEQILVPDVRSAMGYAAAAVHGNPSAKLRVVAVTGTNGKTTTTHILSDLLNRLGSNTAQIGTLSGVRTTPESTDLQRMLAEFVEQGVESVVMEVSSHALQLHRVDGMHFALGVFTNLGHDHFDLHGDQEAYFEAKARLFQPGLSDRGLANGDDAFGRRLAAQAPLPIELYRVEDLDAVEVGVDRIGMVWRGRSAELSFGGAFNASNALAALESARLLGYPEAEIAAQLRFARPVPGRFEPIGEPSGGAPTVIVDYAHTPDGLTTLLETARELSGGGRLILVFGCGGDRDAEKRPLMGAAAGRGADMVVLTSDNPRTEDPTAIIEAIRGGIADDDAEVLVEPDRRCAIEASLSLAQPTDIVLIAGKGHEQTQTIGEDQIPFSDRAVAAAALEKNR